MSQAWPDESSTQIIMRDIYRILVESTSDAIYMVDGECRYLFMNRVQLARFGLSWEDVDGKSYREFHSPEQTEVFAKIVMEALKTGRSLQQEHHSNRDRKVFLRTFSPSQEILPEADLSAVVVISKDITDHRELEAVYETLARNSPIGIYMAREGRFHFVNGKFLEYTDYTRDELLNMRTIDLIHPEDRQHVHDSALAMLREGGVGLPYEFRTVRKDGSVRWHLETVSSVIIRGRRAVLGSQMDITRQKLAEKDLRESRERYRTIIDSIEDAYYEVDLKGNAILYNDAAVRLGGFSREELMGMNFRVYTDAENAPIAYQTFSQVYNTGMPVKNVEWEIIVKNGARRQVEVSVSLIRDEQNRPAGFRGIIRDITERRRSEALIRQLAYHDALTLLPNRMLFHDRLRMAIVQAQRDKRLVAVMLMDLDKFKEVNDHWGHSCGDELLKGVAARLTGMMRAADTVSRMGGDEFTILLSFLKSREDVLEVAGKIIGAFKEPFTTSCCGLQVTASIGIAIYPADGEDPDTLIKNADAAMYRAKAQGRNNFCLHENRGHNVS